jgi:hypothetical protein
MVYMLFCSFFLKKSITRNSAVLFQASPSDPENFPFVVLGNKTDVDSGNSRVVSFTSNFF